MYVRSGIWYTTEYHTTTECYYTVATSTGVLVCVRDSMLVFIVRIDCMRSLESTPYVSMLLRCIQKCPTDEYTLYPLRTRTLCDYSLRGPLGGYDSKA